MNSPLTSDQLPRWRFWALAALILCGQLAGFVHVSSVAHSICDDHGELVHGEHHAGAEGAERPHTGEPARGHGPTWRAVDAPHAEHHHCTMVLGFREDLDRAAPSAQGRVVPLLRPEEVVESRERAPAVARYRIAPKQSPPC